MSPLGFKARVGSLIRTSHRCMCYTRTYLNLSYFTDCSTIQFLVISKLSVLLHIIFTHFFWTLRKIYNQLACNVVYYFQNVTNKSWRQEFFLLKCTKSTLILHHVIQSQESKSTASSWIVILLTFWMTRLQAISLKRYVIFTLRIQLPRSEKWQNCLSEISILSTDWKIRVHKRNR